MVSSDRQSPVREKTKVKVHHGVWNNCHSCRRLNYFVLLLCFHAASSASLTKWILSQQIGNRFSGTADSFWMRRFVSTCSGYSSRNVHTWVKNRYVSGNKDEVKPTCPVLSGSIRIPASLWVFDFVGLWYHLGGAYHGRSDMKTLTLMDYLSAGWFSDLKL